MMLHRMLLVCAVLPLFVPSPAQGQPSLQWLAPLIGVWDTEDTYYPADGKPAVERGVRTCGLVMHEAYLQCETVVSRPDGTGRTYRFLINYNRTVQRFEMLSLWSNVPHKAVQSLTPSTDRTRWVLENVAVIGDDEPMGRHWSEMVFESPDRIVWTGRRVANEADPRTAPRSFHETWIRRPTPAR